MTSHDCAGITTLSGCRNFQSIIAARYLTDIAAQRQNPGAGIADEMHRGFAYEPGWFRHGSGLSDSDEAAARDARIRVEGLREVRPQLQGTRMRFPRPILGSASSENITTAMAPVCAWDIA